MDIDILAYELKYKNDPEVLKLLDAYKEEIDYRNMRIVSKKDDEGDF